MLKKELIIGTRGSALALAQADLVSRAIKQIEPSLQIDIHIIQTQGDINQNPIPLDTVGKSWFTREIEDALMAGEIDIAVHSLKDMADAMPEGLYVGAYLPREDARDVLITKNKQTLAALPVGAIIGTDSTRRQIQIKALRPDFVMQSVRGNVPTRIEKLSSGSYDAIILAAAGLKRLGLEDRITYYFDPYEITPAPGQGILAIQAKKGNEALEKILTSINDGEASQIANIERSFSRIIGGGCKSPIGAYAWREGNQCHLIGLKADANQHIFREEITASWDKSEDLGILLAKKLLARDDDNENA